MCQKQYKESTLASILSAYNNRELAAQIKLKNWQQAKLAAHQAQ